MTVKLEATPGRIIGNVQMCEHCGGALTEVRAGNGIRAGHIHEQTSLMACKNLCNKEIKGAWRMTDAELREKAYEVWVDGVWTWYVLKKWQTDDHKPYARWFCLVRTPMSPDGDLGDTYASDIMSVATRVK
jgi:hypothetical protein